MPCQNRRTGRAPARTAPAPAGGPHQPRKAFDPTRQPPDLQLAPRGVAWHQPGHQRSPGRRLGRRSKQPASQTGESRTWRSHFSHHSGQGVVLRQGACRKSHRQRRAIRPGRHDHGPPPSAVWHLGPPDPSRQPAQRGRARQRSRTVCPRPGGRCVAGGGAPVGHPARRRGQFAARSSPRPAAAGVDARLIDSARRLCWPQTPQACARLEGEHLRGQRTPEESGRAPARAYFVPGTLPSTPLT